MDSTKIICEIDGKEFRDEKSFYHHRKLHHSSKMRDKKCNKCDKTFFTQRDLTTHEVKDQHNTESFHCVQCEKIYSKRANSNSNLHANYNSLENTRKNIKDRARRFFAMIKSHSNKMKTNRENYEKKLRVRNM